MVSDKETESYSIIACAVLSVIGCVFIIISGLLLKKLQTYAFRLVIYLSVADLIASISNNYTGFLVPGDRSSSWCTTQAVLQNASQLSSLLITFLISFSLFEMIVKENYRVKIYEAYIIALSFIIPILMTPLPYTTNSYGDSNGWCWIEYDKGVDIMWMIIEFYGPLLILFFVNIYFYYRIYKKIWYDSGLDTNSKIIRKLLNRLKMYPIVLIICFGPSLFHRIYYLGKGSDNPDVNLIAGCFNALYGFANTMVYGFTGKVRKSLKAALGRFFKNQDDSNASTTLLDP